MFMITPGTGMVLGSLLQGIFGVGSQNAANRFNERAARSGMQWRVEDLKKAGLNPILAAGGSGAQTSAASQVKSPEFGASAMSAIRMKQEIKNLKATEKLTAAQEYKAYKDADYSHYPLPVRKIVEGPVNSAGEFVRRTVKGWKKKIRSWPKTKKEYKKDYEKYGGNKGSRPPMFKNKWLR